MLTINPFADLATIIPAFLMQYFVVAMVLLIIIGTGLDMLHKKNVVYFFRNAQKAKKSAKTELGVGKKTALLQSLVWEKEGWRMSWECMEQYFFGWAQ